MPNFEEGEKIDFEDHFGIEIVNSNHMDILEMDAASKTGIDDIRELIENAAFLHKLENIRYISLMKYTCYRLIALTVC